MALGCVAAGDHDGGYRYVESENQVARVVCGARVVRTDEVLSSLRAELLQELQAAELGDAVGLVDFIRPSLVGTKASGDKRWVEYLFMDTIDENARLVGEGGIRVVVEACAPTIEAVELLTHYRGR